MKTEISIRETKFQIPSSCISKGYRNQPVINLGRKEVASILKQYVQQKYSDVVVWCTSETYSGGSSVNVYLSDYQGLPIEDSIYRDVDRFASQFTAGRFNGMVDMYEYGGGGLTDDGIDIDNSTKYVFVNNRPKPGSPQDLLQSIKDMMAGKYVFGTVDVAGAVEKLIGWGFKETEINKALKMM